MKKLHWSRKIIRTPKWDKVVRVPVIKASDPTWLEVEVVVPIKYTGFGRDVVRRGQAVERVAGERFACPEYYAVPLANKGMLKVVGYIKSLKEYQDAKAENYP